MDRLISCKFSLFSKRDALANLLHQLNYWRQIINTTQMYIVESPELTDVNKVDIA